MAFLGDKKKSNIYITTGTNIDSTVKQISVSVGKATRDIANGNKKIADNANKTNKSLKESGTHLAGIGKGAKSASMGIAKMLAGVLAVSTATSALYNLYKRGIEVQIETDGAQSGIAGLIASMYDLKEVTSGKVLDGPEKFAASMSIARKQVQLLRVEARNGVASFGDLLDTYQQGIGPAGSRGVSPDKVREVSSLVANTTKGMGLNNGMAGQEMRALMTGKIDKTATIGSTLQFGPGGRNQEEYKAKLKAGGDEFAEYLVQQLKYMKLAGIEAGNAIGGVIGVLKMNFDQFAQGTINQLSGSFRKLLEQSNKMFNPDTGGMATAYQPLVDLFDALGGDIGNRAVEIFTSIMESSRDIGQYFKDNQQDYDLMWQVVDQIGSTLLTVYETIKTIIVSLAKVFLDITGIGKSVDGMTEGMTTFGKILLSVQIAFVAIEAVVKLIAKGINDVISALRAFLAVGLAGLLTPVVSAIRMVGQLLTKLDKTKKIGENIIAGADQMQKDVNLAAVQLAGNNNPILGVNEDDVNNAKPGESYRELTHKQSVLARQQEEMGKVVKGYSDLVSGMTNDVQVLADTAVINAQKNANGTYKGSLAKTEADRKKREADKAKGDAYLESLKISSPESTEKADPKELKRLAKLQKEKEKAEEKSYQIRLKALDTNFKEVQDKYSDQKKYLDLYNSNNLVGVKDYYKLSTTIAKNSFDEEQKYQDLKLQEIQKRMQDFDFEPGKDNEYNDLKNQEKAVLNEKLKNEKEYRFSVKQTEFQQKKALQDYSKGLDELRMKMADMDFTKIQDGFSDQTRWLELNNSENLVNIQDYYDKVDSIAKGSFDEQQKYQDLKIEAIRKSISEFQVGPGNETEFENLKLQEKELIDQKTRNEKDYQFTLKQGEYTRKKALEDYSKGLDDLKSKIATLNGDNKFGRDLSTSRELDELRKQYAQDPEALKQVDVYAGLTAQRTKLNDVMEKYNRLTASQTTDENRINNNVDNMSITEMEGLKQVGQLRQSNYKGLQEYRKELDGILNNTQDPELINQIKNVQLEIDKMGEQIAPLAKMFDDLFYDGLTSALTEFINGTKSAKDAFKDFASSITEQMSKLVSNKLVTQLFNSIFDGGKTDSNPSGVSALGSFMASLFGSGLNSKSSGGSIPGNAPVKVHKDEVIFPGQSSYVMNASNARRMESSGGAGVTIIQNVAINARDKQSFNYSGTQSAEMMNKYLRQGARNS